MAPAFAPRLIPGGENRSTIRDFYGAGAEDVSRTEAFEFTNGEPPLLLGHNEGADNLRSDGKHPNALRQTFYRYGTRTTRRWAGAAPGRAG
jgi:hypothetical protein